MKWKAGHIAYFKRTDLDANPRIVKTRAEADDGTLDEDAAQSRPFLCVEVSATDAVWLPLTKIPKNKPYRCKIDPRWLRRLPPSGNGPWESSYIMDSAITYRGPHAEFGDEPVRVYMAGDGLQAVRAWLTEQKRIRPRRELPTPSPIGAHGGSISEPEQPGGTSAPISGDARSHLEQLRAASLAEPFAPLEVVLIDGRRFSVLRRADMLVPLRGDGALVCLRDGDSHSPVALSMIASLHFPPAHAPWGANTDARAETAPPDTDDRQDAVPRRVGPVSEYTQA